MNRHPALLVTTDGSAHSRRILPHAAAFARAADLRLLLAQVLAAKDTPHQAGESEDAAGLRAGDAFLAQLQGVLEHAAIEGQASIAIARDGEDIAAAILHLAGYENADLIAMDTRGHGVLHHALLGSCALDVLSQTAMPVMLSGAELADLPKPGERYSLVVTSDGSAASREIIAALAPILVPGRFAVTLLRILEKPAGGLHETEEISTAYEKLQGLIRLFRPGLAIETRVREVPRMAGIDTAIIEEALAIGANAIAMSAHGTTAARHLIAGSTALTLLSRSPLPVIMARARQ